MFTISKANEEVLQFLNSKLFGSIPPIEKGTKVTIPSELADHLHVEVAVSVLTEEEFEKESPRAKRAYKFDAEKHIWVRESKYVALDCPERTISIAQFCGLAGALDNKVEKPAIPEGKNDLVILKGKGMEVVAELGKLSGKTLEVMNERGTCSYQVGNPERPTTIEYNVWAY